MQTINYIDCTEQGNIAAARHAAAERAKPYVFMLPMPYHGMMRWVTEDRYATGPELDDAVGAFAAEFRSENDGHAPVAGKDFLAVLIQNYELPDAPTEPDWDALAEERREGALA